MVYDQWDLIKLMRPLVDESWLVIMFGVWSSGSIFLANCLPSSTLKRYTINELPKTFYGAIKKKKYNNLPPLVKWVDIPNNTLDKYFLFIQSYK